MKNTQFILAAVLGFTFCNANLNAAEKISVEEKQLTAAKSLVDNLTNLLDKASDDQKSELAKQLAAAHKEWEAERLKYLTANGYL